MCHEGGNKPRRVVWHALKWTSWGFVTRVRILIAKLLAFTLNTYRWVRIYYQSFGCFSYLVINILYFRILNWLWLAWLNECFSFNCTFLYTNTVINTSYIFHPLNSQMIAILLSPPFFKYWTRKLERAQVPVINRTGHLHHA